MDIKVVPHTEQDADIIMAGPLDAAATRDARSTFSSLLDEGKRNFIIDLGAVDFIDSSGLGALVGFLKKVRIGEGSVRLRNGRRPIQKIFELTHLDRVFDYADGEERLAS